MSDPIEQVLADMQSLPIGARPFDEVRELRAMLTDITRQRDDLGERIGGERARVAAYRAALEVLAQACRAQLSAEPVHTSNDVRHATRAAETLLATTPF